VVIAAGLVVAGSKLGRDRKPIERPTDDSELTEKLAGLKFGKKAVLVGQTEPPKSYTWRQAPSNLAAAELAHRAPAFRAETLSLLELSSDPGVDRYRLSAEIQQVRGVIPPNAVVPVNPNTRLPVVGVYFGYDEQVAADGRRAATFFQVRYNDRVPVPNDRGPTPVPEVEVKAALVVQKEKAVPQPHFLPVGGLPFTPVVKGIPRPWPGEWRQIVIDVSPDGVQVRWREGGELVPVPCGAPRADRLTGDQVRAAYARLDTPFRERLAGSGLTTRPWHPRMPLGVLAYQSEIAFRNVVLEPLP
jgi:hypothetical protein